MKLAFIGSSNWDIWDAGNGRLVAIPKNGNDASGSHFGDRHHIKRLINNGFFNDVATDHGLEIMHGIHTKILPCGGKFVSF